MAKFFYRMQNILDIKYKLEEQAKQEYGEIQARLNAAEERQRQYEQMLEDAFETYKQVTSSVLDLLEIEACKNAISFRRDQIAKQKRVVTALRGEVERARIRLNEAMQERKMHEKLKEKQFEIFIDEMNHQESKEIDELVSYKFNQSEE